MALLCGHVSAQQKSGPRLAYEVYLGCYNQHLHWLEGPAAREDLMLELEGCRELARRVLRESKSREATRLAAYLLLLDTDGGESEQNSELLNSKRAGLNPHLREVERLLEQGKCVAHGSNLVNPSPRLCANRYDVERRLQLWRQ
jgi:hypothetical protein